MPSFLENIPPEYHEPLREAIEAIGETRRLLDEVRERFGTIDPRELAAKPGEALGGVSAPQAARELEALLTLHEQRRAYCRDLMLRMARGETLP